MSMFGAEFEQIWPKAGSQLKLTEFGRKLLKQCETIKKPECKEVDINEFKRKSSNFPLEFGTNTCRVLSQPKERYPQIQKQIASAYPVIHERVLQLYLDFLEHKCQYGTSLEKELYNNMSLIELIQRLLTKRCVAFGSSDDHYLLLSGEKGFGNDYLLIGTAKEKKPLILQKVLSYDEIKLSSFLAISSHSEFINNGSRLNDGIVATDLSKIEREGVVMGLIGARFQKPLLMEYQDIMITPEQNTKENGYGFHITKDKETIANMDLLKKIDYRAMWQKFYQQNDVVYDLALKDGQRFGEVTKPHQRFTQHLMFDNLIMKKRYSILFDLLLLDSQARAKKLNKLAYIHVVGVGLGVWKVAEQQTEIFLESFYARVLQLLPQLNNIAALHFSWFYATESRNLKHNGFIKSETHPLGGIHTFLENRNPADKLPPQFEAMLLIVSYAWDANALPGNEFWLKSLHGSNDPSTACSTLISELHNPFINMDWIRGDNLHIASEDNGIMHISDFVKHVNW
ncbi:uncharacterized protein LOC135957750 isoform X1 [Calliphora vicina]|uniref:uncharacterized protein LOC135957750 isoform X1 n=1 Tax=Calliphora vicina TaxID=7373 RepID=UPI00325AB438